MVSIPLVRLHINTTFPNINSSLVHLILSLVLTIDNLSYPFCWSHLFFKVFSVVIPIQLLGHWKYKVPLYLLFLVCKFLQGKRLSYITVLQQDQSELLHLV